MRLRHTGDLHACWEHFQAISSHLRCTLWSLTPIQHPISDFFFFNSGYLEQLVCMSTTYYLAADLCLRAQRDNLLGKLRWFRAKAICNTV